MKLLLDTHLLLWAALQPDRIPQGTRTQLSSAANALAFSPASLWEVVIKRGVGRDDFRVDPRLLWRGLLDNGYVELPITAAHTLAVQALPPLHKDPFDRILIAQALVEGITLLTADPVVARYPAPVRLVHAARERPA